MQRNYAIIASILVIIILIGVLVYMLFFSDRATDTSRTNDIFSNVEFDSLPNNTDGGVPSDDSSVGGDDSTSPEIERLRLRQLTNRNVAGFGEVTFGSTTPPGVYFAESGVGHVYRIDIENGTETRISATTIPNTRRAVFSTDGTNVAFITGDSPAKGSLLVGTLTASGSVRTVQIADNVVAFRMIDNELLYAEQVGNVVRINNYSYPRDTSAVVATIPYREATVVFNSNTTGPHLIYPKTSSELEGFVYTLNRGNLSRLPIDGFGFAAQLVGDDLVYTKLTELKPTSTLYKDATHHALPFVLAPEKCTSFSNDSLLCGYDSGISHRYDTYDNWQKGVFQFKDSIWLVDAENQMQLINISAVSGRDVDIINPQVGDITQDWYFMNKSDQSLWWYDATDDAALSSNQ